MIGVLRRQLTGEISFWPEISGQCYYWSHIFDINLLTFPVRRLHNILAGRIEGKL